MHFIYHIDFSSIHLNVGAHYPFKSSCPGFDPVTRHVFHELQLKTDKFRVEKLLTILIILKTVTLFVISI